MPIDIKNPQTAINRYVFRENGIMNYKVNFYLNDEESES